MKVIAVCTWYNTEADGSPVADDLEYDDPAYPKTFHGPFDTIEEAYTWMTEEWPDGDTDIAEQIADEYEVEPEWLNSPDSLFAEPTGAPQEIHKCEQCGVVVEEQDCCHFEVVNVLHSDANENMHGSNRDEPRRTLYFCTGEHLIDWRP